jgi:two-component system response regulator DegU
MNKISVLVVDRQPFVRAGLRQAISQGDNTNVIDIIECEFGRDEDEAIARIQAASPDVVVLGTGYPNKDGLELCQKIVRIMRQTRVIMLTTNPTEDDDELFDAIRSGAAAYLAIQHCDPVDLAETIKRASRGEYPIDVSVMSRPQVALRVLKHFQAITLNFRSEDEIAAPLNANEVEILNLVAKGNSNKEIGDVLGASDSVIKKHISSILRKLNANDRAHAVALAIRGGFISSQPDMTMRRRQGDIIAEASNYPRIFHN